MKLDIVPTISPLFIIGNRKTIFGYFKVNRFIPYIVFSLNQAFADAYSILEKELFESSATDGAKVEDSFNLLQKIIPSFVGK